MKKKNILVILPSYYGGGAEKVILNYLINNKHSKLNFLLFVANNTGPLKKEFKHNKFEFQYSNFYKAVPKLISFIKDKKIDLLVSTFPHTSIVVLFLKILGLCEAKIIVRQPNILSKSLNSSLKLKIIKLLFKKLANFSDIIIVTSKYMQGETKKYVKKEEKIILLRNPVSIKKIRKNVRPKRIKGDGLRIVFVGRLVYQKGLDRLLPLLKNIKDIKLLLIGEGTQHSQLLNMVNQLGIQSKVIFTGYMSSPYDYIAGADFFVLPSRWEGLPNSALESLALGTKVLTFEDIQALQDYKDNIRKKDLIMCKNEKAMKNAINALTVRKDYKKLKLRKNLLKNNITPDAYQQKVNHLILKSYEK